MMTALVLLVAAAEPAPTRALIWAGGATPEAGAEAMKSFEAVRAKIGERLTLAAGYPKLIESKSLAGLKPGFHVVLLGVCKGDDSLVPLAVLKSLEPKVYSRAVSASESSCPKVAGPWNVTDARAARGMTSVLLTLKPDRWNVLTMLQDASGDVIDFVALDETVCTGQRGGELPSISSDETSIAMDLTCYYPGCTTLASQSDTYRFVVKAKRIKQSKKEGKFIDGWCD